MTLTMVRLFLIIAIYAKSVQNITKEAWMCCHSHSIYACTGIWYSEMLKSLLEIMLWTILWRSMIIWNYFEISNMLCCKLASSRTSSEHLLGLTKVCCMVDTPVTLSSNEPECRWNENSLYIPGHSKCILTIRTAFLLHSKYSVPFICYWGGGGGGACPQMYRQK